MDKASKVWAAAEFSDAQEKTKFMKLMGAYKGGKSSVPAAAAAGNNEVSHIFTSPSE